MTDKKKRTIGAIGEYVREVKEGVFPDDDHTYGVDEAEYEKFLGLVDKRKQI